MALSREAIIKMLFDVDAVKFGDFKLKSGIQSPIYFNLRVIISFPTLMCEVSELLWKTAAEEGKLSMTGRLFKGDMGIWGSLSKGRLPYSCCHA